MKLNEWILVGETGCSSKTIWAVVSGTITKESKINYRGEIPYDPSDFSRCYKLYKNCNLTKSDLIKVAEIFPIWKPFVDNWDKLTQMYEQNESEQWRNYKKVGMYEFIQELVEQGRLNAGWIKIDDYSWRMPK